MLTLQNKADIYDLLIQGFSLEEKIPLASLALFLNLKKFSYQEYGYKKLKSLLNDLSFLTVETDSENHSNVYVTIHSFSVEKEKQSGKASSKEEGVFTDEKRKKISSLLQNEYSPNVKYSLSTISKFLIDHKVDYKSCGFSKMRKLIEALSDTLTLEEDKKNHSIVNVILLPKKAEKKKKVEPKKVVVKKEEKKDKSIVPPKPEKGCFYVPSTLILSVKEFSNLGLDNDSLLDLIFKDYASAYKKNNYKTKDDAFIFPLSFKSKDNEPVIGSIKKAGKGASYQYYLNFIGTDKEKARDYLSDKVFFTDIEASMSELSSLARKEKWCYHNSKDKHIILKIYLQYTFYQVYSQNKLVLDNSSSFAAFNTGLKDENYNDIYGVLLKSKDKNIQQEFLFQGFCTAGGQGLGKIIVEHFNPLPLKATYIQNINDYVFDSNAIIHTDLDHIIFDNIDRFPFAILETLLSPFKEEKKIIDQIKKETAAFPKDKLFTKLKKIIQKNTLAVSLLKNALEHSIAKARRMVSYDYRNCLPSYFPTRNVMSLMLPLIFDDSNEVGAILLIEKTPSGNYQGQTMLTLKQCYVNARLISPLENTFLNPSKIED